MSTAEADADLAAAFLETVGQLKVQKRTGWVRSGVHLPESIADHMYRMSVCCLLLGRTPAEAEHMACLALVHDLSEAIVGDITPDDKRYTKEEKHALEQEALAGMLSSLSPTPHSPYAPAASLIDRMYQEYEGQETEAARVVKDIDRFDMALQAYEYSKAQPELDLSSFFASVRGKYREPRVAAWGAAVEHKWRGRVGHGGSGDSWIRIPAVSLSSVALLLSGLTAGVAIGLSMARAR